MNCPHCNRPISDALIAKHLAAKGGTSTSDAKRAAARLNGRKGGRPKKANGMTQSRP